MSRNPSDSAQARITRPPVPDAEKRTLVPLRMFVDGLGPGITPPILAHIQTLWGAYWTAPKHPAPVSAAVLDYLSRTALATWTLPEAQRRVGQQVMINYTQSLLGRGLIGNLVGRSPDDIMSRLPQDYAATSNYGTHTSLYLGPGHWRFDCEDQLMPADYVRGILDVGSKLVQVPTVTITYQTLGPRHFAFFLRWDPKAVTK